MGRIRDWWRRWKPAKPPAYDLLDYDRLLEAIERLERESQQRECFNASAMTLEEWLRQQRGAPNDD